MRLRYPTKSEWCAIAVIVALLVLVAPPTPHWRETSSQSCHICGNRRILIRVYRWWSLHSDTIEPVFGAEYPIPESHTHEWWQYSSTYNSWSMKWAADNSSRYKDGRFAWTP
ncbi:MAG: hypothetical protein ABJZ55_12785 [Fuerstiella sp.]